MAINKTFTKRILMLCLVIITCISTALKCKKDDWIYEGLPGLEGKKVFADIIPNKALYKVGDTLSVEVSIKPSDLSLDNFDKLEEGGVTSYILYDKNNNSTSDLGTYFPLNDTSYFSTDKSVFTMASRIKITKKGSFTLAGIGGSNESGHISVSVFSGQRIPRGYLGLIPIIFNINNKGYLNIEVE